MYFVSKAGASSGEAQVFSQFAIILNTGTFLPSGMDTLPFLPDLY